MNIKSFQHSRATVTYENHGDGTISFTMKDPWTESKNKFTRIWRSPSKRCWIWITDYNTLYYKEIPEIILKEIFSMFDTVIVEPKDWISGHSIYVVYCIDNPIVVPKEE